MHIILTPRIFSANKGFWAAIFVTHRRPADHSVMVAGSMMVCSCCWGVDVLDGCGIGRCCGITG
jgi:hypothetical protein